MRLRDCIVVGVAFAGQVAAAFPAAAAEPTIGKASFSCKPVPAVRFTQGASTGRFSGLIQRWQQACFSFSARKGQSIKLDLVDFDGSATLALYRPGYRITYGNTTEAGRYVLGWGTTRIPINTYEGSTLTPPPEAQDAAVQTYSGALPQTGTYLIVVELAQAGASRFGGRISIR